MPLLVHAVVGALRMHSQAVELAGKADCEIADIDHFLHFAPAFLQALAHLIRNEAAEVLFVLAQFVTILADDLAPLGSGEGSPYLEGFLSFADHMVVFFPRRFTDAADQRSVDW